MKILVTGANGFVGSNVIQQLYSTGKYDIIATDLGSHFVSEETITYIKADLSQESFIDNIKNTIEQCDAIIHIGAYISYDLFAKEVTMANCFGVQQIIKISTLLKCKKVIFISSVPVIGEPVVVPVTEDHIVNPQTAYHASKVFAEHLLLMNHGLDIKAAILRITSPIGPNMPKNRMLSVFIDNCLGNKDILIYGKGIRKQNYVDVRDIGNAIDLACQKDAHGIFNIAGAKSYTSIELAEICQVVTKNKVNLSYKNIVVEDEYYNWEISTQKAKDVFGYDPQYTLQESVENIILNKGYKK